MDCLVPSLSRIPRGRWFCPTCEASGLISDYLTQRPRRPIEDTLPRTIENVRIRATIQRTIMQVSALVGAVVTPRRRRKKPGPKKKRKTKKKSPTKKNSTGKTKSGSPTKKGTK